MSAKVTYVSGEQGAKVTYVLGRTGQPMSAKVTYV
jgi:hypothetical protein